MASSTTNSRRLWCGLGGILVAIGCGGAAPPERAAHVPTVSVVTLETSDVALTNELPGRTMAYTIAEIRPQVNGLILKRHFTEGETVEKGALLYSIDPAPYQAAYDQAEAALAVAKSRIPALESRSERLTKLAEIHATGAQDADDAAAALMEAQASVLAAEAALESARVNLSYTPIRAPITGRIGRSSVTAGALVTAYQPQPLAVIQQLDPIYVDVTQASSELLSIRRAMDHIGSAPSDDLRQVALLLEDGSQYLEKGFLEFRDVTVDPTTGSVTVRMTFPNPKAVLLPGMYVRAVVHEGVANNAILAPQQGVTRDAKGRAIAWIVTPDDIVEQRILELDRAVDDQWLVTDGLQPGDQLIVEGRLSVHPGVTVNAIPFEQPVSPRQPSDGPAPVEED